MGKKAKKSEFREWDLFEDLKKVERDDMSLELIDDIEKYEKILADELIKGDGYEFRIA